MAHRTQGWCSLLRCGSVAQILPVATREGRRDEWRLIPAPLEARLGGGARLFADLQLNHAAHTRDFSQAAGTASDAHAPADETPLAAPSASKRPRIGAPPLTRPTGTPARLLQLQGAPKLGDSVVVPSTLWPAYTCLELGGAGWMATVVRVHKTTARVTFDHARTRDGRPYERRRNPDPRPPAPRWQTGSRPHS